MRKQISLRAVALAGVCLMPLAAAAQTFDLAGTSAGSSDQPKEYNNEIDIGARYQSGTSPLFGRYNGHDSKGFSSLGGIHLEGNLDVGSPQPLAYELTGTNLDFGTSHRGPNNALAPESEINASVGQQGTWKASAYYDAITYTGQTFYTPYPQSGAVAPGVVTNTAFSTNVATLATQSSRLRNSLVQETAGTRRDIGGVDGKYIFGDWLVTSGYRHEHKEGTVLQTVRSSLGGTAFGEPVDYDTDHYSVQGQFATRKLQAQLGYDYSKFSDNNSYFLAPYIGASGNFVSQYSLPPSNDAHYVTGRLGYNLTPTTRLNTNFRYGIEMSEASPGTGTGNNGAITDSTALAQYLSNPTVPLMARTYDANTSVVSRPITALDLKASYAISGRETSNSPTQFYGYNLGDSATASTRYTIVGQSWTKQKIGFEAGYRILPSTKLTLGYTFDLVDRDAGDANYNNTGTHQIGYWVGHSDENTLSAKLSNSSIPNVNTSLTYEHGVRSGRFEFLSASSADAGAFYQAPRTADRIKGRADYAPNEQWTAGLNGKFETNRYHYQADVNATQRDANATIGPDLTFSPVKAVTTHLFYNYEQIYYVNRGNNVNVPDGYSSATTDSIHTVGLGGDWHVTDRLKVGVDYTFSYGDVGYNMYSGIYSGATTNSWYQGNVSLPSVSSSMHSVKLQGEYQLLDNITLVAAYGFELYKDNDWSYNWNPVLLNNAGTSISTLSSGESANSYRVHSLYTAVRFKF
ncbi:MtrB/PioB family decaheme-associated outer membrane protein [Telmatospirillum siberiense]|nr:MtrB/PioB family decaheme-associated outer membrane protein [Telmatospirillum siberiense]